MGPCVNTSEQGGSPRLGPLPPSGLSRALVEPLPGSVTSLLLRRPPPQSYPVPQPPGSLLQHYPYFRHPLSLVGK